MPTDADAPPLDAPARAGLALAGILSGAGGALLVWYGDGVGLWWGNVLYMGGPGVAFLTLVLYALSG